MLLDAMCEYEMSQVRIVEVTERSRFYPQTDRRTGQADGQTDKVKPVYPTPPFNFVVRGYKNKHYPVRNRLSEIWCEGDTLMVTIAEVT